MKIRKTAESAAINIGKPFKFTENLKILMRPREVFLKSPEF
ncbi:MAG: hypothetical protein CM15mP54_15550 [Paracoccaceae bacterium]|nr:MAG: hypothetical protein CM15mP54_15550 [Paracoccaceae bacterium]